MLEEPQSVDSMETGYGEIQRFFQHLLRNDPLFLPEGREEVELVVGDPLGQNKYKTCTLDTLSRLSSRICNGEIHVYLNVVSAVSFPCRYLAQVIGCCQRTIARKTPCNFSWGGELARS